MANSTELRFKAEASIILTLPEAMVLKKLSALHYDGTCRHSGKRGFVNACYNQARWGHDDPNEKPFGHFASAYDCDLTLKILEGYNCLDEAWEYDAWLSLRPFFYALMQELEGIRLRMHAYQPGG